MTQRPLKDLNSCSDSESLVSWKICCRAVESLSVTHWSHLRSVLLPERFYRLLPNPGELERVPDLLIIKLNISTASVAIAKIPHQTPLKKKIKIKRPDSCGEKSIKHDSLSSLCQVLTASPESPLMQHDPRWQQRSA